MSEPSGDKKGVSRRDFFKLGGLALLGAAGATQLSPAVNYLENARLEIKTGVDWRESPWSEIDFVNRPELLVDNPNAQERLEKDISGMEEYLGILWQRMAIKYNDPTILETYKPEAHKVNNLKLMNEVISWASNLHKARTDQLDYVEPEIAAKYSEPATYLRANLMMYSYFKNLPEGEVDNYFELFDLDETLPELLQNSDLNDPAYPGIKRGEIDAHWNYNWKRLIATGSGGKSLLVNFFGYNENPEVGVDIGLSAEYLHRGPLNQVEREVVDGKNRPKEVKFIEIDKEVATILEGKLKHFGMERAITSVGIDKEMLLAFAYTQNMGVNGDIFMGSPLNLETYQKYERLIDSNFFHETFHVMEARAVAGEGLGLPDDELMLFRNLQLKLLTRFDPLGDMRHLFNPEGEYLQADPSTDDMLTYFDAEERNLNDMTFPSYYFQSLEDQHQRDERGRNIWQYTNELRSGLLEVANVDLDTHFGLQIGDDSLESIFERLESQYSSMTGISALIAKTMIENRADISVRTRATFKDERTEPEYFVKKVVPYIIAHLGMYKFDEVLRACDDNSNKSTTISFLKYWRREMDRFIRGDARPSGEFSADIFSGALIDDAGNIDWGDSRKICLQMVDILKRNELARGGSQDVV